MMLASNISFLYCFKNAKRGIENLMSEAASRSSADDVGRSKRKRSQLTSAQPE